MADKAAYPIVVRPAVVTALLLAVPLVAGRFTAGVDWSAFDFAIMGSLLFGAGLVYELATRTAATTAYRVAAAVALASAFLLVWVSLGVGVIGSDGDPANAMFAGVIGVGIVGAILARFRPRGMARALFAMALAQLLVAAVALILGLGQPASPPLEILGLTAMFVALFVTSALLFRRAALELPRAGT